jgi:hypothetical protein
VEDARRAAVARKTAAAPQTPAVPDTSAGGGRGAGPLLLGAVVVIIALVVGYFILQRG